MQACVWLLAPGLVLLAAIPASAQLFLSLFQEDFEGLPLGPNVEEPIVGDRVWSDVPPDGWTVDRSGVPGWDNPPGNNGTAEWIGWSFADRDWWVTAANNERRSEFARASGTVMVADPDEWSDRTHPPSGENGWYNTAATTPAIAIDGLPENALSVSFDSSWRPEFDDDFHQSGAIEVSFDGGPPVEIMRWLSDPASPDFKPDATNEFVRVPVSQPPGASSMEITFRLFDAGDDWWWAIDNVDVAFEAEPLSLEVNTTTGEMRILASPTPRADFDVSSYSITSPSGSLNPGTPAGEPAEGDYNNSARVEQTDLDLVLLNWGRGFDALPAEWTNQRPGSGIVDQAELDPVLLQWGATGSAGGEGWLANNLAARGVDSIGDGIGESWEPLIEAENQLFEAFLLGSTLFYAGRTESIGEGFRPGDVQDLEFIYSTVEGREIQGNVVYVNGASPDVQKVPEPSALITLAVILIGRRAARVVLHCGRSVQDAATRRGTSTPLGGRDCRP